MDRGDAERYFQLMYERIADLRVAGKIGELATTLSILARNLVWSGKIREGYGLQSEASFYIQDHSVPIDTRCEVSQNWGEIYIATGKYNRAIYAIEVAKTAHSVEQKITYYRLLSMAFNELGKGKEARVSAKQHFSLAQSTGSHLGMARALRNESIADMLMANEVAFKENGPNILEKIENAKNVALDADNVDVLSAILYAEAMYYERLGKLDKARDISMKGLLQTQQVGYVHREMLMSFKLATIASLSNDVPEALKWTDKTISLARGDGEIFCYESYLKRSEAFKRELLSQPKGKLCLEN